MLTCNGFIIFKMNKYVIYLFNLISSTLNIYILHVLISNTLVHITYRNKFFEVVMSIKGVSRWNICGEIFFILMKTFSPIISTLPVSPSI